MLKRRVEITEDAFPSELSGLLAGAKLYDSSCNSGAKVYYADNGYYIKTDARGRLCGEAKLNRLFAARGMGVEVIDYISADRDYLVTRSADGEDLTHLLDDPEKVCEALACALRTLHEQSVEGVPVSSSWQHYMEAADRAFAAGKGNDFVLMDRFRIASKEEAWRIMQESKRVLTADTLIHADACLPNVIHKAGRFSAFIDVGMAGVGDRHIDLYWAIWSLQFNLKTDAYTDLFLNQYGRESVCEDKLRAVAAFEFYG